MSDIPTDWRDRLDIRAEIARIDRDRAETAKLSEEARKFAAEQAKFSAEQAKLSAEQIKFATEQAKLSAEQIKLSAEARKLDRDRWLAPALAIAGLLGGIATVLLTIARALKWVP
jgi:membrane protein involved in colicin uptake